MKAIRVYETGGPEVLKYEEMPDRRPGPARSSCAFTRRASTRSTPTSGAARTGAAALPYTPGSDGAGVIEAIGAGVQGFAAGDRVYLAGTVPGPYAGTYAEWAVCDALASAPAPARTCRSPRARR